jgi:hypothetical protein
MHKHNIDRGSGPLHAQMGGSVDSLALLLKQPVL